MKRILCLEDSEDVQRSIARKVIAPVYPAYDLDEAITLYVLGGLDDCSAIITDINLDRSNSRSEEGLYFVKMVRQTNKDLPIYVYSDKKLTRKALAAGATAFFEKRVQFRDLVDRVNALVEEK